MGEVTHDQANLLLRLYELRREPRMREAREWYFAHFKPTSIEDAMKICPPGSKENAYMRMVLSYWDMATSMVNRGLINDDFFFENSGEQWLVWERVKPVVPAMRTMFKNPNVHRNLEESVKRLEAWREKSAPGSIEAMRQMMATMSAEAAKAQAK
jgi:hypothetical protein